MGILSDLIGKPERNILVIANDYNHYRYFMKNLQYNNLAEKLTYVQINNIEALRGLDPFIIFLNGWRRNRRITECHEIDRYTIEKAPPYIEISDYIQKDELIDLIQKENDRPSNKQNP